MKTGKYSLIALLVCLMICYGIAACGGYFTSLSVKTWYLTLHKPSWNPPNWVFAPMWTFLYGCMAVSVWLVWSASEWKKNKLAISLFFAQLFFNFGWSVLFFGLRNPFVALIDLIALWGFILATLIEFRKFNRIAAFLFFLYLAWVSYAFALNLAIVALN